MPAVFVLRSRWFVLSVNLLMWLLVYLAVTHAGGRAPEFRDDTSFSQPAVSPAPVNRLAELFSPAEWARAAVPTNMPNPFFTRYFVPPTPTPVPPPTTRKIEITYQGFFQTEDGPKRAVVKIGDGFMVTPVGSAVANQLFVADAGMQVLTLTNHAAQTNFVPLNTKKEFEVPLP